MPIILCTHSFTVSITESSESLLQLKILDVHTVVEQFNKRLADQQSYSPCHAAENFHNWAKENYFTWDKQLSDSHHASSLPFSISMSGSTIARARPQSSTPTPGASCLAIQLCAQSSNSLAAPIVSLKSEYVRSRYRKPYEYAQLDGINKMFRLFLYLCCETSVMKNEKRTFFFFLPTCTVLRQNAFFEFRIRLQVIMYFRGVSRLLHWNDVLVWNFQ